MKPISVRPRKFKVEYEELGDDKGKLLYIEEFGSEGLVEHSLKLLGGRVKGEYDYGRDGNKLWMKFEGDRKLVMSALAGEIIMQAVENERDALDLIRELSSNALMGVFFISEDKAMEIAREPLDLTKFPKEILEMSVGEIIEKAGKAGVDEFFGGDMALKSFRQMVKDGIIGKDDKLKEALPKIHEYRMKEVMG